MTFCIIFYEKMTQAEQAEQAEASLTASHVDARKLAYFGRSAHFAVAQPDFQWCIVL